MTNYKKIELPEGFEPPKAVLKKDYFLEVLGPKHNDMDYEAWTSSREELKDIFGPRNGWPGEVTSLEENLKDLTRDYQEFLDKEVFRYAIFNSERNQYIGCFYIRPTSAVDYDCRIDFWFIKTSMHHEKAFHKEMDVWLKSDWGFKNIAYPGRNMSWEEYYRVTSDQA